MKDMPTNMMFHSHEICPDCSGALGKPSVAYTRQIIDIPIKATTITEHVIFKRYCFSCKRRVYPAPDLSSYTVGKHRIGINLMGLVATMREEERQPYEMIQNHLKIFYHLKLSVGEITTICQKTAHWGQPQYEAIKQTLLDSTVIYADETGGRENGRNGYYWNYSNEKAQLVLYDHSRGSRVVESMIDDDYAGAVVSDFYAAYNIHLGFHQRCWVHYLRDMKELKTLYPTDKKLQIWTRDIKTLYEKAKAYIGPPDTIPIGLQQQMREQEEAWFKQKLRDICQPYLNQQTVFSTLNARALKYIVELFTFVRFSGVKSDNNTAEKALRHLVVSRKISGGTRSAKGSKTKAILTSLFGTWRLQNLNPFEQTKLLLLQQAVCQRS